MEQDRGFLEAIRDDPDDDLHRLAWADWLDDHGQTRRADFIRAQVRLAALPADDPARDALQDEADDLLAGHDQEWAGRLGAVVLEWGWRRGCIERVTLWADTLLTHGEELFALAPIRELRLLTETGDTVHLAGCALLSRLETLDLGRDSRESFLISAYLRDRALQQLLVSPHLGRVTRLRLRGHGVEGPLIQTLLDTGLFARLTELDLANNHALGDRAARLMAGTRSNTLASLDVQGTNLTAFGVRHLLQARSWPALRRLELNAGLLFPRGLGADSFQSEWASAPLAPQLTTLRFSAHGLDREALSALLSWPGLASLEELTLWSCRLDAPAGEALAGCASLANLRCLHLGNNQLRDLGARALASSPHLGRLTSLKLAGNGVGGPGIRALAASLDNLTELDLSGNYVGAAGAEAITSGKLRRLTALDLSDANLDGECAQLLAGSPGLSRLRALRLSNNPLGAGIQALAASPHLMRLRELYLDSCGLDAAAARALVESPHLDRVVRLGMRNTYITMRERERLSLRFGPGAEF